MESDSTMGGREALIGEFLSRHGWGGAAGTIYWWDPDAKEWVDLATMDVCERSLLGLLQRWCG